MEKFEIRSFSGDAAPRLSGSRTIEGYALVFGQESRVLAEAAEGGRRRMFVEVIEPGAVSEEMLQTCDVKALLEHNTQRMLARRIDGHGSLDLCLDAQGLKYRFEAPATQEGDYAVEMVRRGDLFGSSFAYATDEKANVTYERRADGLLLRRVKKIDRLFDVAIVSDPAYMGTSVSVRSLDAMLETPPARTWQDDINEIHQLINQ